MKQIVKQVCEKYEFTIDNSWNNKSRNNYNKELKMETLQILGWIYLGVCIG